MNQARMFRYALATIVVAVLSGCGSYHSVVLYEPSTPEKAAAFVPGDGCSGPRYRFGTVSSTRKAMVFLDVTNGGDHPKLGLSVVIEGVSRFNFNDDKLTISSPDRGTGASITLTMNNFRFSTGGGRFTEREIRPLDDFVGPPRASFRPYYPENAYEGTQWNFSSQMALPLSRPDRFSVQIPGAVIDGENISFPLVTFQRRETNYRVLCLK